MGDIFYIIIFNFVGLPAMIYRNFQYAHELLIWDNQSKGINTSNHVRKFVLFQSWGSNMRQVRLLGFVFYVVVAYFTLILAFPLILCSLVRIVKILFDFHFIWFTTDFLGLSGGVIFVYSCVMHVLFSFLDWIFKRRNR